MSSLTRGEKQSKKFIEIYNRKIAHGMKPSRALAETREEAKKLNIPVEPKW